MADTVSPHARLLRDRNFLLYLVSRTANVMGVHILVVAVGWHVWQLTRDPLDLGYIGLAQFAPHLLTFLVAGMATDRFDRRAILVTCNAVHLVAMVLLVAVLWQRLGGVPAILAILVLHGVARAFFHTAIQAILPNIVPIAMFPRAVAVSSVGNKVAQLGGPALGGFMIALSGNGDGAYFLAVGLFACAGIAAATISGRPNAASGARMTVASLLGGCHYIWRNKVVLGAISIDLLAVLFGGVMGLLPIYAADILNVGPEGLGIMRAMPGVGSLLVGIALARINLTRKMGPAMFVALAIFGIAIIVFSVSEIFWISLLALAIYGAADMVSVYVRLTLVQVATPDNLRGRVSAVNAVSINASNELGDFRGGLSAAAIGVVPAVLVGGLATLLIAAIWARIFPELRRVDRIDQLAVTSPSAVAK